MLNKGDLPGSNILKDDDVILVTGGNGCYGNGVRIAVENLGLKGKFIYLKGRKEGDLTDLTQVEKIFQKYKPNYVIHLAAVVGGIYHQMKHKVEYWCQNVEMNNNILFCCDKFNVKKVVSCLSTVVFPQKVTYPVDEKTGFEGPLHPSNSAYGYAKRMLLNLGKWFSEKNKNDDEKNTKFVSVIPTNLYGPFDDFNLKRGHVVPSFVHKCYIAKYLEKGKKLDVWGSGKPQRQFLYSVDAGELILWALLNYKDEEEPVIFTPTEELEIKYVAETVAEVMDFKGGINCDTSKPDGVLRRTVSNQKLMKLFPNYKFTPFKIGIKNTSDFLVKNYQTVVRK